MSCSGRNQIAVAINVSRSLLAAVCATFFKSKIFGAVEVFTDWFILVSLLVLVDSRRLNGWIVSML